MRRVFLHRNRRLEWLAPQGLREDAFGRILQLVFGQATPTRIEAGRGRLGEHAKHPEQGLPWLATQPRQAHDGTYFSPPAPPQLPAREVRAEKNTAETTDRP
jgi:hypothetical protein